MDAVTEIVATVARGLREDIDAVAWSNADAIAAKLPDFQSTRLEEALRVSCRANIIVIMDALRAGVPVASVEVSAEALGYARAQVMAGIGLEAVHAAYRVGAYDMIDRWSTTIARAYAGDPLAVPAVTAGIQFFLGWTDNVLEQVTEVFRAEDERFARERTLRRLADVRSLLDGSPVVESVLEARLGYRLTGRHQAAVLRTATGGVDLVSAARTLFGRRPFLQVEFDDATLWCWGEDATGTIDLPDVWVGVGRARDGLDGFRLSHAEAAEALRVAELDPGGAVASIEKVAVTALCVVDPRRAREFVAAALGDLIADTPAAQRQRETLQAYLEVGMNSRQAGTRLGLHHNTVRYRLGQIEELLGRPIAEHRLELEVALRVHADFGGAD